MKAPKLPKDPIDGYSLEWWTFESCDSWCPGLRRHLAIYIKNRAWKDVISDPALKAFHCYTEKDREGGAFVDHWMMIHEQGSTGEMRFDGRADGWDSFNRPRGGVGIVYSPDERWADSYATPQHALVAFKEHAQKWIKNREEQLAKGRAAIGQVADKISEYIALHEKNPAPSI